MPNREVSSTIAQRRKPTLRDIAQLVGVHPSTVSAVLNHSPRAHAYSEETKKNIQTAARQLGYVPNPLARSLKKNRTDLIGVVTFCQQSTYFTSILQGVEEQAHRLGFEIITADMRRDGARFDHCVHLLTAWRVEGIVLMIAGHPVNRSLLRSALDTETPYVEIGSPEPNYSSPHVTFDDFGAGRLIAEHLVSLGHTSIGVLAGNQENRHSEERLAGIRSILRERGIDFVDRRVIKACDSKFELSVGHRAAGLLLEEHPEVTAIICMNDAMAIGAIRRIRESGLEVPKDISVAGFDDICLDDITDSDNRLGAYITPSLTTIRAPLEDMGKAAASMLVETIRKGGASSAEYRCVEFPPELVVRESTGPVSSQQRKEGFFIAAGAALQRG